MESLADDVVSEILKGFSIKKQNICPICRNKIVRLSKDVEAKSNFYYCSKCGCTLSKPRK